MTTTIASILNGNSLNSSASVVSLASPNTVSRILAPAANQDSNTASSSITFISPSAQALFSQESFMALATALLNQLKPPTVNDFKVLVKGVVTGLNGLRQSLANAASANANFRESQRSARTLNSINSTLANNPKEFVASLKKVGIEQQSNGSFTLNQNQLTKAYTTDRQGAVATVSKFASQVSDAADAAAMAADDKRAQDAAARRAADAKRYRQAQLAAAQEAQSMPPIVTQAAQPVVAPVPQSDPSQQSAAQQPANQQFASQVTSTSFTAQTAVTSYLAVSSL
jgi:hypothetical protein